MCEVIVRIKKSRLAEMWLTRDQYQGREVIDFRVWVQESSGIWKPNTKEVQLNEMRLDAVAAAFQFARR